MPQTPTIIAQLVHIQGPLKGRIQEFARFPVQIGRHSSCQIRFGKEMTTISRHHARIERQGNRFRIIDSSTNGTFINGKRIADVYLRDGDVITFAKDGPKASFLTKISAGSPPTPLPPINQLDPSHAQAPPSFNYTGTTSPPQASEPNLTAGPGMEIPVISTDVPIVIQFGPTLQTFNLLPIIIGADPSCDFVIHGGMMSNHHMQIFFSDEDYYVKDLTGLSMVTINGRPVNNQAVLAQGAELALTPRGPKFRFLGNGRLAEIQDLVLEPSDSTDLVSPPQHPEDPPPASSPKKRSLLQSLFKKEK